MRRALFVFGIIALALTAGSAQVQQSRCSDCHFANPNAPGPQHLTDWELSAHSRASIGCERCHGGNAATFEPMPAHRGILMAARPASPVNRKNVPSTCGQCHASQFVQFQKSHHFEMLQSGDSGGPICTTCHGEVAARILSPKGIEAQCNQCHGPGKKAPREGRSLAARQALERVRDVRAQLAAADRLIAGVRDKARQKQLQDASRQAEVPLKEAVFALHSFVLANLDQRLDIARDRTVALYASIVSGPAR